MIEIKFANFTNCKILNENLKWKLLQKVDKSKQLCRHVFRRVDANFQYIVSSSFNTYLEEVSCEKQNCVSAAALYTLDIALCNIFVLFPKLKNPSKR